jgi:hypothetical protein
MRSRIVNAVLCLALLVCVGARAQAQEVRYADETVETTVDSVRVRMSGIDDIGSVFVLNSIAAKRAKQRGVLSPTYECRWGNGDGSGSWSIGSDLTEGENFIAMSVYNLVYTGFSMRASGGKASWSVQLTAGGQTVWSGSKVVDYNQKSLMMVTFVKAIRAGDKVRFVPMSQAEKEAMVAIESLIDGAYMGSSHVDINWEPILHELAK